MADQTKKNELASDGIEPMLALQCSKLLSYRDPHFNQHIQLRHHRIPNDISVAWLSNWIDQNLRMVACVRGLLA